jgi:recombination protein RecA
MDVNRERAVDLAMSQIEKQFGKGAIMKLGVDQVIAEVSTVSTGSLALDMGLGVGGVPRGRVVEIFGPESSGKTTLALQIIAEAQKEGGIGAFIDAEHALDTSYARKLGVKLEDLLISQPDNGEQALEIAETLVRSGALDVLVVDSVAALVPRAELEGDMGDPQMGLQARLMSQALRKLTATIARSRTIVIFINQIRMKIGVMFGNPETTTGGNALKFYASVRMDIRRIGAIKQGDDVIGSRTKVKIVKNKVAPPFREAEFDILYGQGISRDGEIIDLGADDGIIEKSGSWYAFEGERIGQGRENAKDFLRDHPDIKSKIEAKIRAKHGVPMHQAKGPQATPADAGEANGAQAAPRPALGAAGSLPGGAVAPAASAVAHGGGAAPVPISAGKKK